MYYTELLKQLPTRIIENCQPYVFVPNGHMERFDIPPSPIGTILASPFPIFSYEVDGCYLTSDKNGDGYIIKSIIAEEIGFNDYIFYVASFSNNENNVLVLRKHDSGRLNGKLLLTPDSVAYQSIFNLTHVYLTRLHNDKIGTFSTSHGRFKYGRNTYKPKNIIYVSGSKSPTHMKPAQHMAPVMVHHIKGWKVSAHWRRLSDCDSLGMDRYGERTVTGYTWIENYSKGDITHIATKIRRVK